jgi:hypothetical protein
MSMRTGATNDITLKLNIATDIIGKRGHNEQIEKCRIYIQQYTELLAMN